MGYVSTKSMLEIYAQTGDYAETARHFGMSTQTVHSRITYHLDKAIGRPWLKVVIREKVKEVLQTMEDDR